MESFSQYSLSNNILKLKKYDKKQAKKPHKKSDRIITSIKYLVVQTLHSKSTIVRALLIHTGVHCTIRLVRLTECKYEHSRFGISVFSSISSLSWMFLLWQNSSRCVTTVPGPPIGTATRLWSLRMWTPIIARTWPSPTARSTTAAKESSSRMYLKTCTCMSYFWVLYCYSSNALWYSKTCIKLSSRMVNVKHFFVKDVVYSGIELSSSDCYKVECDE